MSACLLYGKVSEILILRKLKISRVVECSTGRLISIHAAGLVWGPGHMLVTRPGSSRVLQLVPMGIGVSWPSLSVFLLYIRASLSLLSQRKLWWLQPADALSIICFNMAGLGVVGRQSSHLPCHQAVMRRSRPEMATNTVRGRTTGKRMEARAWTA